jgi:voltage-gated potassium channel
VHPLDANGQVFKISLITAGVIALFVALAVVTEQVMSGQLGRVLRGRRIDPRIGQLDQHCMVAPTAASALGRRGTGPPGLPFLVVERQEALVEALEEQGVSYFAADTTAEEVLHRAGIERARALEFQVSLCGRLRCGNVFIPLTTGALNPDLVIGAMASDPTLVDTRLRVGADQVVVPYLRPKPA